MIKDIVSEIVEEIRPDAIQLMRINDIPALKKITGEKVVYDGKTLSSKNLTTFACKETAAV